MKQLRIIRIVTATLFFVASAAFLIIGPAARGIIVLSEKTQIILSALSVTIGATLVWFLLTLLFGRIYCSTVCPIGWLTELFARLGRSLQRRHPKMFRPTGWKSRCKWSGHILVVYVVCLLIGLVAVPFAIEPWNITRNIFSVVHPSAVSATWIEFGYGAATGIVAGIVSFMLIAAVSTMRGREFCTDICPLGTALGLIGDRTLYHIEIDPDMCISCGKCEDVCTAHCIKVVSRYVDNPRCLRCLDCISVCPNDAIRFQINRTRRVTPLLRGRQRAR